MSEAKLEAIERLAIALDGCLDAAVREIPDPTVQPFPLGGFRNEKPETNTLDPSIHEVPTSQSHDEGTIIASAATPESPKAQLLTWLTAMACPE